jgi:hypothetical protein
MKTLLDILQGAGLAGAAGVRPFLPGLVAGALASGDIGVDFDGTDLSFLESPGWLLALLVGLVIVVLAERRLGAERVEAGPLGAALGGIALGVGALLFAGALADHAEDWWPGLPAGLACALLAQLAVRNLLRRTRTRLDPDARAALPAYAEGVALVLAALSVVFPPIAVVALAFFAWLLIGGRRRAGEKYAGLRILR